MAAEPAPGALQGVRVLDLVDGPGAYATRLLAGMGAEVIRVEPPRGAAQRGRAPFYHLAKDAPGPSLYFLHYNAGKRGITLDTRSPVGRGLLERLLATVEVVVDNGDLEHLGFDLDALTRRTPLVVVSITPFGLRSVRRDWLGGDLICQAMSGMIGLFGYRNERPARFGAEQAFEMGGLAAALGALIALFNARRSGAGDVIEIALERVGALVGLQTSNASVYHQFGFAKQRPQRGEALPGALYEARDGWITLAPYRRPRALVEMLQANGAAENLPELLEALPAHEFSSSDQVEAVLRRFAAGKTRADLIAIAQAFTLIGLPVHDAADLLHDPFLQERAFFVAAVDERLPAALRDAGPPIRFGATPYRAGRRPPLLGEHNEAVYAGLGIEAAALEALRESGVI